MSEAGRSPLDANFLEFVEQNQLLRHKPSGLIGKCVAKGRSAWIDGRQHNLANFVNATLEFSSGRRISFTHLFLEELPPNG